MDSRTAFDNLRAALIADIGHLVRTFFPTATAVHLADEADDDPVAAMTVGIVVLADGRDLHLYRSGITDAAGRSVDSPDGWPTTVDAEEWDGFGSAFAEALAGPATSLVDVFGEDYEDGTFIELPDASVRTGPVSMVTAKAEKHLARALKALTGHGYQSCLDAVRASRDDTVARHIAEAVKDTGLHGTVTIDGAVVDRVVATLCTAQDGVHAGRVFTAFRDATGCAGTVMVRGDAESQWDVHFEHLADADGNLPADVAFTDEVWEQVQATWAWSKGFADSGMMGAAWELVSEAVNDVLCVRGLIGRTR